MNISGSDVSKEAANMILLDDNFASCVQGVKEGRQIFANLKRSIQYTLSHSTPEVLPQLLYVVVPIPLPLSAILILVIDLGFELFVALSFAWDPPETADGLMRQPPRKPVTKASILGRQRRALRKSKTLHATTTTHTQDGARSLKPPSKLANLIEKARTPFTRAYWTDLWESRHNEDETLVDSKLLSWAYLESGMIQFAAAILSYFIVFGAQGFSPSDLRRAQSAGVYFLKDAPDFVNHKRRSIGAQAQLDALARAQSIYYLSVFITQCFNLFAVKARFTFPFGKRVVSNPYNFAGILAGAVLGMFVIYTPPLRVVFGGTYLLSPLYWLIPVAFGVLLLAWACVKVVIGRRGLEKNKVKDIRGLMMCEYPFFPDLDLGGMLTCYCDSPDDAHDEHAPKVIGMGERVDR
jgi:sodium/potassium-transporting ATPase subunit alpha